MPEASITTSAAIMASRPWPSSSTMSSSGATSALMARELLAPFLVDQRHDETEIRVVNRQVLARPREDRRHESPLPPCDSRQHRQPATGGTMPRAAHRPLIRDQGNVVRHGVADEATGGIETVVEGFSNGRKASTMSVAA